MKKLSLLVFIAGLCISFNANAFFFFYSGSAVRAISDAISGAKGDICVKDSYKVGDKITSPGTGNTGVIVSLSGTSSKCNNPATPIRAEVEFTYNFSSKAGIELPDDYEQLPITDLDRFNGRLMSAKSRTNSSKAILISSFEKKPNSDIEIMANNASNSQVAKLANASSKNPERIKINGLNAVRFEVSGTTKATFGKDMTYLITLIDAGKEILFINEWCPTAIFPDSKFEFIQITESIKGLEGEKLPPNNLTEVVK